MKDREKLGLPFENTLTNDEFLEATLDVWDIPPESAQRVGHPAPFPVELPERLIELYTYAGDLVLDPFMGSGSTLVAAAKWQRRYAGYDLDGEYVGIARRRVAEEVEAAGPRSRQRTRHPRPAPIATPSAGRGRRRNFRAPAATTKKATKAAAVPSPTASRWRGRGLHGHR